MKEDYLPTATEFSGVSLLKLITISGEIKMYSRKRKAGTLAVILIHL